MRKLLVGALVAVAAGVAVPDALATGQPNVSCESGGTLLPGFTTAGFANASAKYAGAENTPSLNGNSKAVSQYDIACFGGPNR